MSDGTPVHETKSMPVLSKYHGTDSVDWKRGVGGGEGLCRMRDRAYTQT